MRLLHTYRIVLLACIAAFSAAARAQDSSLTRPASPRRLLPGGFDFTIVDAPYNFAEGLRGPSMRQALDL